MIATGSGADQTGTFPVFNFETNRKLVKVKDEAYPSLSSSPLIFGMDGVDCPAPEKLRPPKLTEMIPYVIDAIPTKLRKNDLLVVTVK